jgi:hypothetical protein
MRDWRQRILHWLTPFIGVLLEKLIVTQLVKKFLAIYGTRRLITMFTIPRYWSSPWARRIQSTPPPPPISLRSILILRFITPPLTTGGPKRGWIESQFVPVKRGEISFSSSSHAIFEVFTAVRCVVWRLDTNVLEDRAARKMEAPIFRSARILLPTQVLWRLSCSRRRDGLCYATLCRAVYLCAVSHSVYK